MPEANGPKPKNRESAGAPVEGRDLEPAARWNDQRVETLLGTLLQTGVMISGLVVLAGGILYMLRYGRAPVHYENFDPEPARLHSIVDVGGLALHGDARAIIQLGLLILIATPVARVLFSMIAFGLEKDRLYVVLTLIVFVILVLSLLGKVS
jgi:uncharacterized membrane protein